MKNLLLALTTFTTIILPISPKNNLVNKASPLSDTINYSSFTEEEAKSYYSSLEEGQKGDALLTSLQNILKEGQVKVNYNSGYTEGKNSTAWYGYSLYERNYDLSPLTDDEIASGKFKTSDIWINVLYLNSPIYIESTFNAKDATYKYYPNYPDLTGGPVECKKGTNAGFDREHILPKSFGFNSEDDSNGYKNLTAGCDAHNLHVGDRQGNQEGHNSYPYGEVSNTNEAEAITSAITGETVGYLGTNENGTEVFEPLDKDKGDIARSIFYMCARYHYYEDLGNGDETPAITLGNNISKGVTVDPIDTKDKPVAYGELDDLLKWNIEDPVSEFEIQRNDLIYFNVQGNRNPFIDYPYWANACFDPDNSTGIAFSNFNGSSYTFKIEATSGFKTNYNFLDNFSLKGINSTLLDDGTQIHQASITYYLGDKEIKEGDTLFSFGSQEFYAVATTNDGVKVTSNKININITFSTLQIVIGVAIILLVLIILVVIFTKLSKRNKRKVKKAFKNKLSKTKKK